MVSARGHAPRFGQEAKASMAGHIVPHFHNDLGVSVIEIGASEFMCVGANPPFDSDSID